MAHIQWRPEFATGIARFDNEHQKLVAMLNELYQAMGQGAGQEALGKVLAGLVGYTKTHFAGEEALMRQHGYPEFAQHKAIHDALTTQVLSLEADLKAGKVALSLKVANFLKDWLTKHIMETDRKYGPFLQSKGVR